jgi:hypothetical protein
VLIVRIISSHHIVGFWMHRDLEAPFDSPAAILARSARLFLRRLPFLAAVTLAVFVPGKTLLQVLCFALDIAPEGLASYLLMDVSDLILSAWTIPSAIHGLVTGEPFGACLRYGRRLWGRMLWNKFKVEITIALYSLLLFVPGLIAMTKLALTDAIVAMQGDREPEPLARSAELTAGYRWRVFFVVTPLSVLDLAGSFYLLGSLPGAAHSRWMLAAVDSAWAVAGMWMTVAGLIMYVGRVGKLPDPPQKARRQRR